MKRSELATWQIDAIFARTEAAAYQHALNRRLREEATGAAYRLDLGQEIQELARIAPTAVGHWSTPESAWLVHEGLARATNGAPVRKAIELLGESSGCQVPPITCHDKGDVEWTAHGLSVIGRSLPGCHIRVIKADARTQSLVADAIELVGRVWPEALVQLAAVTRCVLILEGSGLRSSSVPSTFGATYLCPKDHWTSLDIANLLVHEAAHHSLEIKCAFAPMLENEQDVAASPLRDDPRPLWGILHATFVLVRVGQLLSRAAKAGDPSVQERAREELDHTVTQLAAGLKTLNERARWTPDGRNLIASISNGLRELQVG